MGEGKKIYRIDETKLIKHTAKHSPGRVDFNDVHTGHMIGFPIGQQDRRKTPIYVFSLLAEPVGPSLYELVRLKEGSRTTDATYPEVTREDGKPLIGGDLIVVGIRTPAVGNRAEEIFVPKGGIMLDEEYQERQAYASVDGYMELDLDDLKYSVKGERSDAEKSGEDVREEAEAEAEADWVKRREERLNQYPDNDDTIDVVPDNVTIH